MNEQMAENPQEELLLKKSGRTHEEIKKLFVDNYILKNNIDPEDDRVVALINDLAEREIAHSKSVSKLIKQKISWREKAAGESPKETPKESNADELKAFRDIERKKALEQFLSKARKEYKIDPKEVYDNLQKEYRESSDDVRREDFYKQFKKAFKLAYPSIAEKEIEERIRKEMSSDGPDYDSVRTKVSGEKRDGKTEPKFFKRSEPVQDWFKRKS